MHAPIRLEMKNGKDYDWPVDKVREFVAQGLTHAQIGEIFGVCGQLISKVCRRHNIQSQRRGPRAGAGHPQWKGGSMLDKHGYRMVWLPEDHPMVCMIRNYGKKGGDRRHLSGYVFEHRLVMAMNIGRPLEKKEVVHHKDGDHLNNQIENLELFSCNADHLRHELTGHCPKWTPEGLARMRAAHRGWCDQRRPQSADTQTELAQDE